jgi:hypothetical protein
MVLRLRIISAATAALLGLAACGSSSTNPAPVTTAASATTYAIVPAAAVAGGLADTTKVLGTIAAAGKATQTQLDQIETSWHAYEGTIKQTDPTTYLAIEDTLNAFKKAAAAGDATAMAKALADFGAAAAKYLAAHPA